MINFADDASGNGKGAPNFDYVAEAVAQKIAIAKNKWIKQVVNKLVPDFVIEWTESGKEHLHARATKWMSKKQFHIQEHPDGRCRFLQGNKLLSEFRVVMDDGKVSFEMKDYKL